MTKVVVGGDIITNADILPGAPNVKGGWQTLAEDAIRHKAVVSAIEMAFRVLRHPDAKEGLAKIAKEVLKHESVSGSGKSQPDYPIANVDAWLNKLETDFVRVQITLLKAGVSGKTLRYKGCGNNLDNWTHDSGEILLHSDLVFALAAAQKDLNAELAKFSKMEDKNAIRKSQLGKGVNANKFFLGWVVAHEITHLWVGFVRKADGRLTPPTVAGYGLGDERRGESGWFLEASLLRNDRLVMLGNEGDNKKQAGTVALRRDTEDGELYVYPTDEYLANATDNWFVIPLPIEAGKEKITSAQLVKMNLTKLWKIREDQPLSNPSSLKAADSASENSADKGKGAAVVAPAAPVASSSKRPAKVVSKPGGKP
ncbi:hypothetical protein B0T26DRAFT_680672 [Lasiosphaeria miniovina]|uniref:Uncharacterized protein n=1 Tax=Lasiosphaeria miniovina TaxID=1954250 RepID=A0AA40DKJ4_9PEZI|nr:uncharacterized protein B0T26DRAFT_680672 [Lasiosphaeria miniovina]KAK0707104.1 hypothetical protein B0T26DRAFT_680672 [Lasiosphaeria miniovina]